MRKLLLDGTQQGYPEERIKQKIKIGHTGYRDQGYSITKFSAQEMFALQYKKFDFYHIEVCCTQGRKDCQGKVFRIALRIVSERFPLKYRRGLLEMFNLVSPVLLYIHYIFPSSIRPKIALYTDQSRGQVWSSFSCSPLYSLYPSKQHTS